MDAGVFLAGIALGLSLAAPPGPINALMAAQAISLSRLNGFLVGLGAMTADATFLVITYTLSGLLVLDDAARGALSIVSFCLMLLLAYLTWRSSKLIDLTPRRSVHIPYLTGLSVGLTNPFQLSWWMSAGLSLISSIGLTIIVGFFTGILVWITSFPSVLSWAGKGRPWVYRGVIYFSVGLLLAFAAWFLYNGLYLLLPGLFS
ncbi:MAG: LysE family translocator [Candidatus Methanosuratincola sp.]|jgi:threonine/homoserine/homoserine lactone efflux protein|nr:LysE family transporter [Candidatus Methanosuratincola sp.]